MTKISVRQYKSVSQTSFAKKKKKKKYWPSFESYLTKQDLAQAIRDSTFNKSSLHMRICIEQSV